MGKDSIEEAGHLLYKTASECNQMSGILPYQKGYFMAALDYTKGISSWFVVRSLLAVFVLSGRMDAGRGKTANGTYLSKHEDCLEYSIKWVRPLRRNAMTEDELFSVGAVSIVLL